MYSAVVVFHLFVYIVYWKISNDHERLIIFKANISNEIYQICIQFSKLIGRPFAIRSFTILFVVARKPFFPRFFFFWPFDRMYVQISNFHGETVKTYAKSTRFLARSNLRIVKISISVKTSSFAPLSFDKKTQTLTDVVRFSYDRFNNFITYGRWLCATLVERLLYVLLGLPWK